MRRNRRPLIGCTTYRKTAGQDPPIELYGLMPRYIEAIVAAGGLPLLIPLGLEEGELADVFERVDGLLFPGGGDVEPEHYRGQLHPTMWGMDGDRDRVEFYLARLAMQHEKPLLAICRGIQMFNVALGGTLWQDVPSQLAGAIRHNYFETHPRSYLAHEVSLQPGSLTAAHLGQTTTWVNSLHHQGVRDLAPILRGVGTAPDGLIEAVEAPTHRFALGVQWHPEWLYDGDKAMFSLFRGLVEAASEA
ncbi:MAG: gamma-glutamyl-gamma-aminobutyrate hydrolase family protein [Chloroflexota bacterium]